MAATRFAPAISRRTRWTLAVAATASTLTLGVGLEGATAAALSPSHTSTAAKVAEKQSVTLGVKHARGRERVTFVLSNKFSTSKKSWWSVDFGDHYKVTAKGKAPAKISHVFGRSGKYHVSFMVTDRLGRKHSVSTNVQIAAALPTDTAVPGTTTGGGGAATVTVTVDGVVTVVDATVDVSASPSPSGTPAPTTPAPTPTATPTTPAPTTPAPTSSAAHPLAPVVQLLLGLNVSGLLHGTVLNFVTNVTNGTGSIVGYTVNWGDGTVTSGTGLPPVNLGHVYATAGLKTAVLTVNTSDGLSATANLPVLAT